MIDQQSETDLVPTADLVLVADLAFGFAGLAFVGLVLEDPQQ